ncbi:MAG: O-antigen ligase family protein [Deltaproteobacteria bacterium]|nr:O-antigen ligase family protein [Deltaproteobacteria bacterium]
MSAVEPAPTRGDRVRWALLAFFAASLPLGIALQQTALALLLAWFVVAPILGMSRDVVPWRARSPLDVPLAVLAAALLLSTVFCPAPLRSLRSYDRLWIVAAYFATYHLVRTRAEAERLIAITIAAAAVVAVYGVVQHFTGLDLARALVGKPSDLHLFWLGEGYRTKGLHPSGITYAHNLLFPLTFATGYILAGALTPRRRLALLCAWTVMVLALVFSVTRGVWLAFGVVLLLMGLLRGGRTAIAAGAGLAVLVALLVGVDPGIRTRARSAFDLPANLGRTQIWRANLDMARARPLLGWGYGNYKSVRQSFYDRYPDADTTAHAHNDFLQMQVDGGLVSLVAFVALFAVIVRRGWRGYRAFDPAAEPTRSLTLAALLAVVGFLVGGLTQYNFGDAEVVIYLWFTVGILLRLTVPLSE